MGALFGDRLTSIRGGFRKAYDQLFYNILVVNGGNFPITTSVRQTSVLDVYPNLAPATTTPVFNPLATFVNSPTDVENPESYLYSLSIQRELAKKYIIEVGYTGSRSLKGINQLQNNPAVLTQSQINAVLAAVPRTPPLTGYTCPSGSVVAAQSDCAGTVQNRRVFPQWGQRVIIGGDAQAN
jgi:hypothetical protein